MTAVANVFADAYTLRIRRHSNRVKHGERGKAHEILAIEGQDLSDAVSVHDRGDAGVVDLLALDCVNDDEATPEGIRGRRFL